MLGQKILGTDSTTLKMRLEEARCHAFFQFACILTTRDFLDAILVALHQLSSKSFLSGNDFPRMQVHARLVPSPHHEVSKQSMRPFTMFFKYHTTGSQLSHKELWTETMKLCN